MPRRAAGRTGRKRGAPAHAHPYQGCLAATDLVFASIPGANRMFQTDARLPMPLLLLSDTVGSPPGGEFVSSATCWAGLGSKLLVLACLTLKTVFGVPRVLA